MAFDQGWFFISLLAILRVAGAWRRTSLSIVWISNANGRAQAVLAEV